MEVKVIRRFYDREEETMREVKSIFQTKTKVRAQKLIDLGYVIPVQPKHDKALKDA